MLDRIDIADLKEKLAFFPAVAIIGPRQIGKTTLAKQLAQTLGKAMVYLDMEDERDYAKLKDNANAFFDAHQDACILIDEVQAMPSLFTRLRPAIDSKRIPGRFLLLGSASPDLIKGVTETLAGRIAFHELYQLTLPEISSSAIAMHTHWFRGGFPEPLLAKTDKQYAMWAQNFIFSYAERDLRSLFGVDLSTSMIHRMWQMLAHYHGGIWSAEIFARSLGVSAPTVNRYLDFMEGAFLVRKLQPWFANAKKRLIKSPKVYIRCTGILHKLLDIKSFENLQGHPVIGNSWESYVIEQIEALVPDEVELYYYRTQNGAECDVVLAIGLKILACIEIKYSDAPTISKGFYNSIEDLASMNNYVLTPNSDDYLKANHVRVCKLEDFLKVYLPKIGVV
jgi:predicted AAA+ superfamily ATPase